ncbi:MAG: ABC transporter ATP-binding protein [Selenomonadaceae bacterium]|nr:ABC transporter ATP-binding protein [Selenomonadaceae bacterium]MBR1858583.1 ABC transporter ATP-binding protein [Selenomonadaceae bacterium]
MENIIEVEHLSMHFNLMEEKVDSIKEYIVRLIKGNLLYNEFIAIDDISFSVQRNELLGIVGLNGAGKSTLLKILSGVFTPTSGSVKVKGTVAPLIEVGAGFDPELTAKENIFLNGLILGYSRKFIQDHFDEIVDFAELKDFINVPVKNFSSGMYARLGFAIATVVKPDILIVDEVLAVGDFQFYQKCERRISDMIKNGVTIILVSHDINMVERMCTKVLWLERGHIKAYGDKDKICEQYKNS